MQLLFFFNLVTKIKYIIYRIIKQTNNKNDIKYKKGEWLGFNRSSVQIIIFLLRDLSLKLFL